MSGENTGAVHYYTYIYRKISINGMITHLFTVVMKCVVCMQPGYFYINRSFVNKIWVDEEDDYKLIYLFKKKYLGRRCANLS